MQSLPVPPCCLALVTLDPAFCEFALIELDTLYKRNYTIFAVLCLS